MKTLKPISPDTSVYRSDAFDLAILPSISNVQFSGTQPDYDAFIFQVEKALSPLSTASSLFGLTETGEEIHRHIHPMYLVMAQNAYRVHHAPDAPVYILDHAVRDALLNTDLTWVNYDALAALPNAISLVLTPTTDNLTLFHTENGQEQWLPISDFALWRVTDIRHRRSLARSLGKPVDLADDPDTLIFGWMASSRDLYCKGTIPTNWGSFIVQENVKLDDVCKGMQAVMARIAEDCLAFAEEGAPEIPSDPSPEFLDLLKENEKAIKAYREDMRHGEAQGASLANSLSFLIKFVLLHHCDWFQEHLRSLPIPGIKSFPHKARRLRVQYGARFRVTLPDSFATREDDGGEGHKASPRRHWVRGFFREQPYGEGRKKRRTIWIHPFWRGTDPFKPE